MDDTAIEISQKYTGKFCKSLFLEFAIGLIFYVGSIALSISHSVSLFTASIIICLSHIVLFNSMHSAIHRHFSRNVKKNLWIDKLIGNTSAILIHISYKPFADLHIRHHKNTNQIGLDPDFIPNITLKLINKYFLVLYVIRTISAIPILRKAMFKLLPLSVTEKLEFRKKNGTPMYTNKKIIITHGAIFATILTGYGAYGFWLIFVPLLVNQYILVVFFMWLPHKAGNTGRHQDTRDQITPLLNRLSFVKVVDFHLEHHLYPSVPSSYLRKLHFEILDDLNKNKGVYVGRFTGKPLKHRPRH
jgi:ring-1,2-phenylacetyl-CoA epoxidase subunit PaaE